MTDSIKILTPLQQMWHRPGMTIGSTDTPDTLLKEMVDNSSDELINNFANRLEILSKPKEGYYQVRDDGRGLPLSFFHTDNPDMAYLNGNVSAKIIFTREFSSGKYDKSNYPYSVGTNGVGTKACNVFSTKTHIRVKDTKNVHGGQVYELILGWDENRNQTYVENWIDPSTIEDFWWSTEVSIWPNEEVFRTLNAKVKEIPLQIIKRSRPEVVIKINDKEVEPFSFEWNIESNNLSNKIFSKTVKYGTVIFDLSFSWCSKDFTSFYKGTVNVGTSNEGYHIETAKRCIGSALRKYNPSLSPSDAEYGLRMFVDALVYDPHYTGQTKEKLSKIDDFKRNNAPIIEKVKSLSGEASLSKIRDTASKDKAWQDQTAFDELLTNEIYKLMKEDDVFTDHLVARILEYKRSIDQLSDESYINSLIKTGSDKISRSSVKGVIEATSSKRAECELFLCEGRSAGSPIKEGRDRAIQALFELRGKPMNVANAESTKDIVENVEIKTVLNAIGIGMMPNVKIEDARYGKIIIATDADPDGLHIQGLVLGALCFLCPQVFSGDKGQSMVYIANAPLYKQNDVFIYDEIDLNPKKDFKRFKGLGSMLPKDLKTTVVDQKTRRLKRISLDSEEMASAMKIITSSAEKKKIMVDNKLLIELAE